MLSLLSTSCAAVAFPARFALAQQEWSRCRPGRIVIVLEGLDGVGKSSVAKRLAQRLGPGAKLQYALPEDMRAGRAVFDAMSETEKRQFYLIGNLVAAAEADAECCVFDRSYASTVAYHRGTLATQRPLERPMMLVWPAALRPTHYFYLHCDETVRLNRLQNRTATTPKTAEETRLAESAAMRDEIDWCYRHFEGVQEIDVSQLSQDDVCERIFSLIKNRV